MKTIIIFDSIESFATQRLVIKKIQAEDFDKLLEMYTNPQVMDTLGGIRTEEKT